jgi:O-antigen/teichoic acid export membrane protein
MVVIVLAANWLVRSIFKVPPELISQSTLVFRLAGIGFLGSMGMSWGRALAMGLQRFEISYGIAAVSNVIGVGLGLVMVSTGHGVVGYVLVRVITSLLSGPAYWLLTRRLLPSFRIKWGIDRAALRRVRGYVGCGVINRANSSLVSRLDQTLIGVWLGVAAAGVYSVAFLVVNSLSYMLSCMLGFIFPLASELQSLGNMDRLRDIFIRATRFITALAGMIFVPLFVLGDIFLGLWVPSIAGQAAVVLRLLTLAGYLGTLCASLTNNAVIGMGHIRYFTVYSVIRSIVLGASCLLLIRRFGLEGAGWALLATEIVDGVYLFGALRNCLQIRPSAIFRTAYLKPMVLAVVLGAVVWSARPLVHSWLELIGVIGLLEMIYISIGYWMGIFGETEKRAVTDCWQMVAGKSRR